MRKIFVLIFLGAAVAAANPFNTVIAYPLPPRTGYFGPLIPVSIPLAEEGTLSVDPMLWAGYGIFPRFDMTLMIPATYDTTFTLTHIMLEARYDVIGRDRFALSPAIDFFIPLPSKKSDESGPGLEEPKPTFGIGPGIMASVDLGHLLLHGNLFSHITLPKASQHIPLSFDGLTLYLALEYPVADNFSFYLESNVYGLLNSLGSGFLIKPTVEFWPGVSWMPTDWLSLATACGVPTDLGYLTPGLAAYVSF